MSDQNALQRIERLISVLILIQLKGATQQEKAAALNLAGVTNIDIANLLQVTGQAVADLLYKQRKQTKKR